MHLQQSRISLFGVLASWNGRKMSGVHGSIETMRQGLAVEVANERRALRCGFQKCH